MLTMIFPLSPVAQCARVIKILAFLSTPSPPASARLPREGFGATEIGSDKVLWRKALTSSCSVVHVSAVRGINGRDS